MGWYVGFKLHLLCNEKGEIVNFVLTRANVDDREESVIDTLTDKVFGKLYADKGYISQSLFGHLWDNGVHIVTGLRSNTETASDAAVQTFPVKSVDYSDIAS